MKPFNKILIATDGSENAKAAAVQGLALAKLMDAEVTAISVVDVGSMAYSVQDPGMAEVYSYLEAAANVAVDLVQQEGAKIGLIVKTKVGNGAPANEIIEASKDYDLIVMGTLGRTGLAHLLMGSVAEKVVRFASCPVLVMRAHKTRENEQREP